MVKAIYDICKFNEGKSIAFEAVPDRITLGVRSLINAEDGYPSVEVRVEEYVRLGSLPRHLQDAIACHARETKWS